MMAEARDILQPNGQGGKGDEGRGKRGAGRKRRRHADETAEQEEQEETSGSEGDDDGTGDEGGDPTTDVTTAAAQEPEDAEAWEEAMAELHAMEGGTHTAALWEQDEEAEAAIREQDEAAAAATERAPGADAARRLASTFASAFAPWLFRPTLGVGSAVWAWRASCIGGLSTRVVSKRPVLRTTHGPRAPRCQ